MMKSMHEIKVSGGLVQAGSTKPGLKAWLTLAKS